MFSQCSKNTCGKSFCYFFREHLTDISPYTNASVYIHNFQDYAVRMVVVDVVVIFISKKSLNLKGKVRNENEKAGMVISRNQKAVV